MNTFITNENQIYTSVLENVSLTCRNYSHHLPQGDYVRHLPYTQTLVGPYAVTLKDTRKILDIFYGELESTFSTTEVLL